MDDDFPVLAALAAGDEFVSGLVHFDDRMADVSSDWRDGLDEREARKRIATLYAERLAYELDTLTRWYALGE